MSGWQWLADNPAHIHVQIVNEITILCDRLRLILYDRLNVYLLAREPTFGVYEISVHLTHNMHESYWQMTFNDSIFIISQFSIRCGVGRGHEIWHRYDTLYQQRNYEQIQHVIKCIQEQIDILSVSMILAF